MEHVDSGACRQWSMWTVEHVGEMSLCGRKNEFHSSEVDILGGNLQDQYTHLTYPEIQAKHT